MPNLFYSVLVGTKVGRYQLFAFGNELKQLARVPAEGSTRFRAVGSVHVLSGHSGELVRGDSRLGRPMPTTMTVLALSGGQPRWMPRL